MTPAQLDRCRWLAAHISALQAAEALAPPGDAGDRHVCGTPAWILAAMKAGSRDPRPDALMPLDGSWPWRSELGDDPRVTPPGFASLQEAQAAHDELALLWDELKMPERRAFLQWFREEGPDAWPFSREDVEDLSDALRSLRR